MQFAKQFLQQDCVATLGNFDGVHLGHQKILQCVIAEAEALKAPALAIIFEPLPQEFFLKDKAPARLSTYKEKILLLKNYAIHKTLCLRFNQKLASLPAEEFVRHVLVEQLRVKALIIGDDFYFGHKRQGDVALLQKLGKSYGFIVSNAAPVLFNNERISSSRIRAVLAAGNLALATQLLGRSYTMSGHVIYGDRRGRQLGFPTANIPLRRLVSPLSGVFAVRVYGLGSQPLTGVANIGNRPTVDGKQRYLEVHLFDFHQAIYGRYLQVEFVHKLRDEQRFNSVTELKNQISQDVIATQRFFSQLAS